MEMKATQKVTADDILAALRFKHSEDVFVPECKDGPSQSGAHVRLDAWTMNRSWANPIVTGYEVKVSRQDFLKDNKWPAYLPMCNQLYFVCPRDLIQPDELSPEVGLYYLSNTGNRLLIKKKAQHRQVEIPETVWRYILMCRVKVTRDRCGFEEKGNADAWRAWLSQKAEDRKLGYEVAKAIRDKATALEVENERLKGQHSNYDDIIRFLKSIGIEGYAEKWSVERRVKELRKAVPSEFSDSLKALIHSAQRMNSALVDLEKAESGESVEMIL